MRDTRIRNILYNIGIITALVGVCLWSVWPLIKCVTCVADFGNDGLLITWIINTAGRNLYGLYSGPIWHLFSANIYYPNTLVLAYSEMFFITSVWTYPLSKLVQNPTIVYALTAIVGQLLTAFVVYFWNKEITQNKLSSFIATIAFLVSQIRFEYQVHLQMWSMQYFLFGSWMVTSWIRNKNTNSLRLIAGLALLALQVWESLLPVYFSITIIGVTLLVFGISRDRLRLLVKKSLIIGLIALLPVTAYLAVSRQFNYQRNIREAAHNSMSLEEPFSKFLSPGLYILFTVAIVRLIRSKKYINEDNRKSVLWWTTIGATALILALGPVLKTGGGTLKIAGIPIPLPYLAAYYLLPGFGAFRTPSRWMWLAGLAMTGITALGLSGVKVNLRSFKGWVRIYILVIFAILLANSYTRVKHIPRWENSPTVYKWLQKQTGKVVTEVPGGEENQVVPRMIFSLFHKKNMLDGWSGFYPPDRKNIYKNLNEELSAEQLNNLKILGTDYLIIHKQLYTGNKIGLKDESTIWEDEKFAVYDLRP